MSLRTRLHIGYIVPGFPADETDWFTPAVAATIRHVAEQHEVRVVTLRYPPEPRDYTVWNVPVAAVGDLGPRMLWRGVGRIMREAESRPFDVLHAFWATEAGFVGAVAAHRLGVPLVVSCVGGEPVARRDIRYGDWRSRRSRLLVGTALNRADRIVVGSQHQRRLLAQRKPAWEEKTAQIPHGVDTERFRPAWYKGMDRPFTMIYVAGLTPIKNHRLLLRALEPLRDRAWRLHLIGDGPLRQELQAYAQTCGVPDRIRWWGWVHHGEMVARYQQADLLVHTSDHEDHAVAVLEGMACGLPVVATAAGLVPELIENGVNGVCAPCGDERALADGIAGFLDRPERCREAGARSRQVALDYARPVMVSRLIEAYEQICTRIEYASR